jgi:hypothetical protein
MLNVYVVDKKFMDKFCSLGTNGVKTNRSGAQQSSILSPQSGFPKPVFLVHLCIPGVTLISLPIKV